MTNRITNDNIKLQETHILQNLGYECREIYDEYSYGTRLDHMINIKSGNPDFDQIHFTITIAKENEEPDDILYTISISGYSSEAYVFTNYNYCDNSIKEFNNFDDVLKEIEMLNSYYYTNIKKATNQYN